MTAVIDERLPVNDSCMHVVDELNEVLAVHCKQDEQEFTVYDQLSTQVDDIIHKDGDLRFQMDASDAVLCGKWLISYKHNH